MSEEKKSSPYTSIYLDEVSRERLVGLEAEWKMSRSQVIRKLIQDANREARDDRLGELVTEMSALLAL